MLILVVLDGKVCRLRNFHCDRRAFSEKEELRKRRKRMKETNRKKHKEPMSCGSHAARVYPCDQITYIHILHVISRD